MIRLRVPATSANIGPGFDSLGLALSLWNEFEFGVAESTEVVGVAAEFSGEDNLFLKAFREACVRRNMVAPPLSVRISSGIPLARGLGSSASLIVAGVGAAVLADTSFRRASEEKEFSAEEKAFILDVAAAIEGHPDNVAPALYGGFCASALAGGRESGRIICARSPMPVSWRFHALVPPFELSTAAARAALPPSYPRADAVFNAGRAALVALAIRDGNLDLLAQVCEDRLHQPYRAPLIRGYAEAIAALKDSGCRAVWLSGAGPTVIGVSEAGPADLHRSSATRHWTHLVLEAVNSGLCVL